LTYGLALLHRHARRIKTRAVVQNVALLFGTEEIRRINSVDRQLDCVGPDIPSLKGKGCDSALAFKAPTQGCGTAGWASSSFTIGTAGSYFLLFGVTNWNDELFDSGLAIDGVTVNGQTISGTAAPEPASLLLLGIGTVPLLLKRRRS
jgi:hypothetical protein